MPPASPDDIALAVLTKFDALPPKRKPAVRGNGVVEWVPLSGVVAEFPDGSLECLSLATGMKCLPHYRLPSLHGRVLHDSHAEVLALRGLNHYLLSCCLSLLQPSSGPLAAGRFPNILNCHPPHLLPETSTSQSDSHPESQSAGRDLDSIRRPSFFFSINPSIKLHLYCSTAPCGDSSMELVMAAQEDATPWSTAQDPDNSPLPGRANFSRLSIVRRKPSRPDAPSSLSKSCTDKLSLRQCSSLLSSLASFFIHPGRAYLNSVVLPSEQLEVCRVGFARAFGTGRVTGESENKENGSQSEESKKDEVEGRMRPLADRIWRAPSPTPAPRDSFRNSSYTRKDDKALFEFHALTALPCNIPFACSKSSIQTSISSSSDATTSATHLRPGPSNTSTLLTLSGVNESLISGVLQGRKQGDPRGASAVSRQRMWELSRQIASLLPSGPQGQAIREALAAPTYAEVKSSSLLSTRRAVLAEVKDTVLKGWVRNTGDDGFGFLDFYKVT